MFASRPRTSPDAPLLARSASEGEQTLIHRATSNVQNVCSPSLALRASVALAPLLLLLAATEAHAQTVEARPATPEAIALVSVGAVISVIGAVAALCFGRRLTAAIGVDGMTKIALLAALHFAVSFSAKIANSVIAALTGPAALFISEIAGEMFPAIVQAVTVAVVRRPGALALSNLTVSIMHGLCAGHLSPLDLWLALIGATLGEALLLATGATSWPTRASGITKLPTAWPARCAVALSLYNGGIMLIQYSVYQVFFSLFFPVAYVAAVSLVIGCLYGGIGATIGARWGVRLREIS